MRRVIVAVILLIICHAQARADTLAKIEELTPAEKKELIAMKRGCYQAQKALEVVQKKIAGNHSMREESWPEWSSTVEFSGNYILLRKQSHMAPIDFTDFTIEN